MSIGLAMIVKDEAEMLPRTLPAVIPLIDSWTIVDTGSTDDTCEQVRTLLADVPGELHEREFVNFAHNRTELLDLARYTADWLLTLDADMEVDYHLGLPSWLDADTSPHTAAWRVAILENGSSWWLPWLIRGELEWRYEGAVHEYLHPAGRGQRQLLGLTATHLRSGGRNATRFEQDLELLRHGVEAGDVRDIFYTAQTLRFLGRIDEAIEMYRRRAGMGGYEEEGWYAAYWAARLSEDVDGLLAAYARRPWRHEPLSEAARLVARAGSQDDLLFLETIA